MKKTPRPARAPLGIVGGSGLYDLEGLEGIRSVRLRTPFGATSDAFRVGTLGDCPVAFLPRHGRGHRWSPTEINARANVFGLKLLGVERILSVSAVGSLREELRPGEVVVPDQFVDRTRQRPQSFFGGGIVAHVGLADPVCPDLARVVAQAARSAGGVVHEGGTYLCVEGPQFSTRAESRLYRTWGMDLIGMTNLPEARLAREAEICYATLALVTDYDCWRESEDPVDAGMVVEVLKRNVALAKRIVAETARLLPPGRSCACGRALEGAILTDPGRIPAAQRRRLAPLVAHRLGRPGR